MPEVASRLLARMYHFTGEFYLLLVDATTKIRNTWNPDMRLPAWRENAAFIAEDFRPHAPSKQATSSFPRATETAGQSMPFFRTEK